MKKKRILPVLVVTALLAGVLAGCGGADSGKEANADGTSGVKHVVAATAGRPKPFVYTDDDNNVTGYEAEVLYAVDDLLEDYEFEFEIASDTSAVFTGIDAGLYDIAVNDISKTEEREEKYLFGDEFVSYNYTGVAVPIDDDSIHTLEDLAGKKTNTKADGGFAQLFVEKFNEEHADNPIDVVYTSSVELKVLQDLEAGVYDFTFVESVIFDSYVEAYPELADTLKFVTFSDEETAEIQDPYSWYVFPKTEEGQELKEAVDGALKQLKEDGTINELAQKYFHYDVVR